MPNFEIICLANSRKSPGRCIAGLKTDGNGWIRPVSSEGALTRRHYILDNNTEALVLDILNINLRAPLPKPYQPENWLIGQTPWHLVARPAPQKYSRVLTRYLVRVPELFGDTSDRIASISFNQKPASGSLALIFPSNLRWQITTSFTGKRQTRARFRLSGVDYDLVVTDPKWEHRLSALPYGFSSMEKVDLKDDDEILFTISLGGPLQGYCYKLVAAVIVLPSSWRGII